MISAGECTQHCGFVKSYVGLMTDAPHLAFELSLELLTAPFAYAIGKGVARREHRKIDAEHGVVHEPKSRVRKWCTRR